MVAVGVVGGNEVVFAMPSCNAGVGAVGGDGKLEVVLMNSAANLIFSGLIKVNAADIPVYPFFVGRAVGIYSRCGYLADTSCALNVSFGRNSHFNVYGSCQLFYKAVGNFVGHLNLAAWARTLDITAYFGDGYLASARAAVNRHTRKRVEVGQFEDFAAVFGCVAYLVSLAVLAVFAADGLDFGIAQL